MKTFKVGIIGYGWVAGAHIEAINQCAASEVVAVYSARELSPESLAAAHGGEIRAYSDLDAMLADDSIDVISICSYPARHKDQAVAAARAGKHLIIEKPLALSMDDCRTIAQAADEAGVQVCVCFECRYSSQFLTTKAVIDQGLLGEIHYGEVDYYHGIGPGTGSTGGTRRVRTEVAVCSRQAVTRWTRSCCAWGRRSSR